LLVEAVLIPSYRQDILFDNLDCNPSALSLFHRDDYSLLNCDFSFQ